jgi:flagellar basal body P-ring formation protein FlgA
VRRLTAAPGASARRRARHRLCCIVTALDRLRHPPRASQPENVMRQSMITPALFMLLSLVAGTVPAQVEWEDVARIREAAETVVLAQSGSAQRVEAQASVDARLRMPVCSEALNARLTGQNTVEVECRAAGGWHIYVPVRVQRFSTVLVLARPVAPGEPLSADAVVSQEVDVSRISGAALTAQTPLEGMTATRVLSAGTVLTTSMIRRIPRVRRGEMIALVAGEGGLVVQVAGMALADAATGDTLSVRNMSSQRVVQGIVTASGQVLVTF